ncbi:MAG: hypothetical protein K0S37_4445 [Microbacterium sp.]|nr:hypothetical protein [Microbacterium sp.]
MLVSVSHYGGVPFNITGLLTPDLSDYTINMEISIVRYTDGTPESQITPPIGYLFYADGAPWAVNADWWRSEGPDRVGRSIVGHNGAPAAITVAATGAFDGDRVEDYSSVGPVTYYLTPQTTDGTASALSEPITLRKPTLLSVDGARQNAIKGTPTPDAGVFLFDGTRPRLAPRAPLPRWDSSWTRHTHRRTCRTSSSPRPPRSPRHTQRSPPRTRSARGSSTRAGSSPPSPPVSLCQARTPARFNPC